MKLNQVLQIKEVLGEMTLLISVNQQIIRFNYKKGG